MHVCAYMYMYVCIYIYRRLPHLHAARSPRVCRRVQDYASGAHGVDALLPHIMRLTNTIRTAAVGIKGRENLAAGVDERTNDALHAGKS